MEKNPTLTLVSPTLTPPASPRELGEHGLKLWNRVNSEYNIVDVGGIELLAQACTALDRAEQLAEGVTRDGPMLYGKHGPRPHPAIKEELALRAFVCRTLTRLGLNIEPIKPPGRPGGHYPHWEPAP